MDTKNKFKVLSFAERTMNPAYRKKYTVNRTEVVTVVSTSSYNEELGRVVTVSTKQVMDNKDYLQKYRVNDFALENLEAAGFDNFRSVSLSRTGLSSVDHASSQLSKISSALESSSNN